MKIISKYKDVYDYLVQDYNADIVYIRNIGLCHKNYDDLYNKKHTPYKYTGTKQYYRNLINSNDGEIRFDNYIFGIYPFVYSQPIMTVKLHEAYNLNQSYSIILGKDIVDKILSEDSKISEEGIEILKNKAQDIIDNHYNGEIHNNVKPYFWYKDVKDDLRKYVWKCECPEIFRKINAPVWIKYYENLFADGTYSNEWPSNIFSKSNDEYIHYVTDISFLKLNENVLKYWYNDIVNLNTYINIENFLWSIKQEPESNPDNNTKILSHGFDLKTSFRKM